MLPRKKLRFSFLGVEKEKVRAHCDSYDTCGLRLAEVSCRFGSHTMRTALFCFVFLPLAASASTMNGTVSGTCGFYQGSITNVVYSQSFSGDGTFCTGFLAGGSFTETTTLQIGDIFSTASHSTDATAPSGYGVFANFNTTLQATQEYEVDTSALAVQPATPTGTLQVFLGNAGGTDDGTGMGTCSTAANVNIGGHNSSSENGTQFNLPITFGQPFTATETATVSCNKYDTTGWGDSGFLESQASPLLVYDTNGTLLGNATLVTLPEPGTGILGLWVLAGAAGLAGAVRRSKRLG